MYEHDRQHNMPRRVYAIYFFSIHLRVLLYTYTHKYDVYNNNNNSSDVIYAYVCRYIALYLYHCEVSERYNLDLNFYNIVDD